MKVKNTKHQNARENLSTSCVGDKAWPVGYEMVSISTAIRLCGKRLGIRGRPFPLFRQLKRVQQVNWALEEQAREETERAGKASEYSIEGHEENEDKKR